MTDDVRAIFDNLLSELHASRAALERAVNQHRVELHKAGMFYTVHDAIVIMRIALNTLRCHEEDCTRLRYSRHTINSLLCEEHERERAHRT